MSAAPPSPAPTELLSGTNASLALPPALTIRGWWGFMVAATCVNVIAFSVVFWKTRHYVVRHPDQHYWSWRYSMAMRWFALPFVWECAWRSFLPSLYNKRLTIINDQVNSVFIARMFAALGEICWAWQMGLAILVISHQVPYRGPPWVERGAKRVIPVVAVFMSTCGTVAQAFSITGMITTNNVFVVVEESLWAVLFFLGALCCLFLWMFAVDDFHVNIPLPGCFGQARRHLLDFAEEHHFIRKPDPARVDAGDAPDEPSVWVMRVFIRVMALFGLAATPYMIIEDVPKWAARYNADQAAGVVYLSGVDGLNDAIYRRYPSQTYEDWKADQFWLAAYFSVASLASIGMMFAPGRVAIERIGTVTTGSALAGIPPQAMP